MRFIVVAVLGGLSSWTVNPQLFAQSHCCDGSDGCDCGIGTGAMNAPGDPWNKGRIWLRQTGHFGKFYNCDCEEEKRFLPYICWKPSNNPFTGWRLRDSIRADWRRITHGSTMAAASAMVAVFYELPIVRAIVSRTEQLRL